MKNFLEKMAIAVRLFGKEVLRAKLKWFDLRRADYQLGRKAYELRSSISDQNQMVDRINKIQNQIEALNQPVSSGPSFKHKLTAVVKGTVGTMKIQILKLKRNCAFKNLGIHTRQNPPAPASVSIDIKASEAILDRIQRISADTKELAAGTYIWARRPLLAVTFIFGIALLLGVVVSVKHSAAGSSKVTDDGDLLREINAAAQHAMIGQKHSTVRKLQEIDLELREIELEMKGASELMATKGAFESQIADVRRKFFVTYPDKTGAADARVDFSNLLWEKDLWYLSWRYLAGGETGWNTLLDSMTGGEVDGGIPAPARPAFDNWVKAVHQAFLNNHWGQVSDLLAAQERASKAIVASESYYETYVTARDWAEFDRAGIEPANFNDPRLYGVLLCTRFEGMSWEEAVKQYIAVEHVLGRDKVRQVMQKIHDAPKNAQGNIARAEAVGVVETNLDLRRDSSNNLVPNNTNPAPEGAIVVSSLEPLTVAVDLIACDDPRRYLLKLMAPKSPALKLRRDRAGGTSTQDSRLQFDWDFAATAYQRWGLAFGESAVKDAAEKVRRARKRLSDGELLDSDAIGSRSSDPYRAFRDILIRHDPKGYARAILSFHISDGSASAIDAAYQKLVATYGEQAVLAAAKKLSERSNYDPSVWDNFDLLTSELDGSSHPKS